MMDELINYYKEIYREITELNRNRLYFKIYYYEILNELARNKSTSDFNYSVLFNYPREEDLHNRGSFQSHNNLKKKFKKEIKTILLNEIQNPDLIREFNKIFLNESLDCLDR